MRLEMALNLNDSPDWEQKCETTGCNEFHSTASASPASSTARGGEMGGVWRGVKAWCTTSHEQECWKFSVNP